MTYHYPKEIFTAPKEESDPRLKGLHIYEIDDSATIEDLIEQSARASKLESLKKAHMAEEYTNDATSVYQWNMW